MADAAAGVGSVDKNSGGQDESWKIALAAAKKVGYIPSAFSQAIRLLVNDHFKNNGELRGVTKYQVSRIFKGPTFKSTIYFASLELAEDFFKNAKACSIGDLVALYTPLDLSAFITCFFLNRRMKKVAGAHWETVSPHFAKEASVGALMGVAVPKLGFAPGLLLAALRNVSHALLSIDNPKSYAEYRTKLSASKKMVDESLEKQIWKTTSVQVSSMILTTIGFKSEFGEMISTAINSPKPTAEITNEHVKIFRLSYLWSEAFWQKREQPVEKLDGSFYPFTADRTKANAHIAAILGGRKTWLDRGKVDINPQQAPHLFEKRKEDPQFEIPDELKDVFNIEEITKMDELEFDALVDQIDAEQATAKKRDDVISTKDLDELEKQCE